MAFWSKHSNPHRLLTTDETRAVVEAIRRAESGTSGEIRVHIERRCKRDPLPRARVVFDRLRMSQTAEKNGVLIYIAVQDRQFAIYGDQGIHEKVGDAWWQSIRDRMAARFSEGKFSDGICEAVLEVGAALSTSFPHREGDTNELPDEPSIGD